MIISWFILWNFAAGNLHHSLTNTENILKVTLTGFPVSSSKAMKDLPMLISRDFLQMTPLSKQSMFSAATLSITSALLCGGEKTHNHRNCIQKQYRNNIQKQYTETIHVPANGFTLFHWSICGNMPRYAAMPQQRQGWRRLLASKHGCKQF